MGVKSRRKGANGERELIRLLHDTLTLWNEDIPEMKRNLQQYQESDHPDIVLPGMGIEVKRYATITDADKRRWWDQALAQAYKQNLSPALAFRADRQEWRVMLPGISICEAMDDHYEGSTDGFLYDNAMEMTVHAFAWWYTTAAIPKIKQAMQDERATRSFH